MALKTGTLSFARCNTAPLFEESIQAGETVRDSHALSIIERQLKIPGKYNILDLGAASKGNVNFFSHFNCRIFIQDLFQTLADKRVTLGKEEFVPEIFLDSLLLAPAGIKFDVVMCWDLLNYLAPHELGIFVSHLTTFCKPQTAVYALMASGGVVAKEPIHFNIESGDKIRYSVNSAETISSHRYTQRDLLKLMPDFLISRSLLLRNGMQEYLLTKTTKP